ncbi:MAG: anhydro-N-acetylmuramic acid kinase [Bacteroidetes bacterium]|nr:anhydro-N-acetylmuramic acid kinase [Bacteroidota bacterium]
MRNQQEYIVVGIMSGTSLDGIDLALCKFYQKNTSWKYEVLKAKTYNYPDDLRKQLSGAAQLRANDLLLLHNEYGIYTGELVNDFLEDQPYTPQLIASHGHTIFHQPDKKFTFQLGHGACIAKTSKIRTVSDFRTMDVAQGGQGAPLVPYGDSYLFNEYQACLNLGGFANITINNNQTLLAYDICPVNIIINRITREMGFDCDIDGHIARKGKINPKLLEQLNRLNFYFKAPPKSLGYEWLQQCFIPKIETIHIERHNLLRTIYEHITEQLSYVINQYSLNNLIVTGGGAKNTFLMEILQERSKVPITLPGEVVIDFKEAIVFGFMGLMKWLGKNNIFASVTGGEKDICSGSLYEY